MCLFILVYQHIRRDFSSFVSPRFLCRSFGPLNISCTRTWPWSIKHQPAYSSLHVLPHLINRHYFSLSLVSTLKEALYQVFHKPWHPNTCYFSLWCWPPSWQYTVSNVMKELQRTLWTLLSSFQIVSAVAQKASLRSALQVRPIHVTPRAESPVQMNAVSSISATQVPTWPRGWLAAAWW
jgi:hypothetical protein